MCDRIGALTYSEWWAVRWVARVASAPFAWSRRSAGCPCAWTVSRSGLSGRDSARSIDDNRSAVSVGRRAPASPVARTKPPAPRGRDEPWLFRAPTFATWKLCCSSAPAPASMRCSPGLLSEPFPMAAISQSSPSLSPPVPWSVVYKDQSCQKDTLVCKYSDTRRRYNVTEVISLERDTIPPWGL